MVFFDPASHKDFMWDSNYDQRSTRHPGSSFFILGGSRSLTLNWYIKTSIFCEPCTEWRKRGVDLRQNDRTFAQNWSLTHPFPLRIFIFSKFIIQNLLSIKIKPDILFWRNHPVSVYHNRRPLPIRCLFRCQEILNLLSFGKGRTLSFLPQRPCIVWQSFVIFDTYGLDVEFQSFLIHLPMIFLPKIHRPKLTLIVQWTLPSLDENSPLK